MKKKKKKKKKKTHCVRTDFEPLYVRRMLGFWKWPEKRVDQSSDTNHRYQIIDTWILWHDGTFGPPGAALHPYLITN